ncbi:ABC transporter permease [archaeon]|jgi:putative ABC transport system permease protein|nr:ABC transporter permease [archaeon]MBT4646752.1 ABC transporter permease [archaeon]MBT6822045.1 ABC transporter permease [archaeon]MBT7391431.1 ABC transporter permease [archaeon]
MLIDFVKISLNSLRYRKLRSWLTMLGIFIGIAAVVSLIGMGEGLRVAISGQFGFLGPDIFSVQASGLNLAGPPGSNTVNPLADDLYKKIEGLNGVEASFNRHIESGTLEYNDIQSIGMALSVPSGENRKAVETMLNLEVESGRLLKDGDNKRIILGNGFKDDKIFGKGVSSGDRVLLSGETYTVIGILEKKGSFIFDQSVIINEETLLDQFGDDGTTDLIAVKVKDVKNIEKVMEDVEKILRKERDVDLGEEDFVVASPQQAIESLNSTLFAVQLFVYIIASISLIVGGIGIMNTMYTAVIERTKEIGIMKAIGARNSTIFTLFFIESGFLGFVGGLIGILLGLGIANGMSFIGRQALGSELIQASISAELLIGSMLFSFILGTFFGVMPAIQAAKMHPVDALRSK